MIILSKWNHINTTNNDGENVCTYLLLKLIFSNYSQESLFQSYYCVTIKFKNNKENE